MARVVLERVTKLFRRPNGSKVPAVSGLDLEVRSGELLVLLGPSACGKTTALRLIAGLEEPDGGDVWLDGAKVTNVRPRDRDVALVFQNQALYPHLNVRENIALGLRLRRVAPAEIAGRVGEAAEVLGLGRCLDRLPGELSGGERQRLALSRALARRPKVFLFDEPLSNLDPPARAQLRAELRQIQARWGITTICVTHDHEEAMAMGDRVAVMNVGERQQIGTPTEIYEQPANLFVAGFVGFPPMNFLRGALVRKEGKVGLLFAPAPTEPGLDHVLVPLEKEMASRLEAMVDRPVTAGLRPEALALVPTDEAGAVKARVERVQTFGSYACAELKAGPQSLVVRITAAEGRSLAAEVGVRFDMGKARLFDPETGKAIP